MRVLVLVAVTACGRFAFDPRLTDDAARSDDGSTDAHVIDSSCATDVVAGLANRWTFSEASGTTTTDGVGGLIGTLSGGVSWTTGHVGDGLAFDGTDGRVDISGATVIATSTAAFSFSAWFDLTDYSTTTPDIMQMQTDTTSPFHVLMSSEDNYLGLSFGDGDGAWATAKTQVQPTTGVWHHVVMTYKGADPLTLTNFQFYLDDEVQTFVAASPYATQANQSRIGAAEDPENQWHGALDDIRIYRDVLSSAEVARIFAACD